MSLQERLTEDMKAALRAREAGRHRLSVIRMVRAAIKNAEIEAGRPLTDGDVEAVIQRELKQRREALEGFLRADRPEAVARLQEEIAILHEYLPEPLTPGQLEEEARRAIAEVGAASPKELGKVMAVLMPRVRGRAEGREVNETVRRLLT